MSAQPDGSQLRLQVTLPNLTPGQAYYYRLGGLSPSGWYFSPGETFTAVAAPVTTPPVTTPPAPGTLLAPTRKVMWGAQIGTQFTGEAAPWDMNAVSDFTSEVGKAPSIVPFNLPFEGCSATCNYYTFPTKQMNAVNAEGSLVMLNWSSMSSPISATEPAFTLSKVIDGTYDSYIKSFALAAKAWGHPFLLRFDWEMNGNWFPWAVGSNGNTPAEFVAAWQHVHDIFTAAGATNVSWVWCPTADPYHTEASIADLYPGNAYVDWTGLDAYNFGNLNGGHAWQTFSQVVSSTYNSIQAIAPTKPFMLGEVAGTESGGNKAAWITDMFNQIQTNFSNIHAFVWFDAQQGTDDWPLETNANALAAFKTAIASPMYTTNTYTNSTQSPILAP